MKNDYPDRPWVKSEKTEKQIEFEQAAEEERKNVEKMHKVRLWCVIILVLIIVILLSCCGEVAWIRHIAK